MHLPHQKVLKSECTIDVGEIFLRKFDFSVLYNIYYYNGEYFLGCSFILII